VGSYSVFIKPSAAKELEAIPHRKDRQRIAQRIARLADEPRPADARKLGGHHGYRVRQGRWRIVYEVTDEALVVLVIRVADRKEFYRRH
jgi:mRNA interferase RelE/StbE